MTNNWISRITGQAVTESALSRKVSVLHQVLGEADEEKAEKADKPEKSEKPEGEKKEEAPKPVPAPASGGPEDETPAAEASEIEAGAEASADSSVDSQTVEHLVSSWQSGSKMDVASQLMYTPVSYVDFVKMVLRIGEQDAVELGGMLDELSEVRPSIDQPGGQPSGETPESPPEAGGSADRILSRIAQRRQQAKPVAQPAGDTAPDLDTAP
jgi:hypothetical protein